MTSFKKFVDKVEISVVAGHGGAGAVSFRREIYVPKGGPDGGDGGQGGSVILQPDDSIQTLLDLRLSRIYNAKNGDAGKGRNQSGKKGEDKIIKVPKGTMVMDDNNNLIVDLVDYEPFIIAHGGKGGRGNQHFATAVNKVPRYAQKGLPGAELSITLELRLIAEVGLIGLPNAGKSSLLKQITKANPKIANYPFTTLYPNLGVLKYDDKEIIFADIPGLIEGAADGAGLGHDFLRHVARTKILVHLIELIPDDFEQCLTNYHTICTELTKSELGLEQKPQLIVLNKADLVEPSTLAEFTKKFAAQKITVLPISAVTGYGVTELCNRIYEAVKVEA
jgi:GTP-binding protein